MNPPILALPDELLLRIFHYIPLMDLRLHLPLVCQRFCTICSERTLNSPNQLRHLANRICAVVRDWSETVEQLRLENHKLRMRIERQSEENLKLSLKLEYFESGYRLRSGVRIETMEYVVVDDDTSDYTPGDDSLECEESEYSEGDDKYTTRNRKRKRKCKQGIPAKKPRTGK